jgi:hypothetical protein
MTESDEKPIDLDQLRMETMRGALNAQILAPLREIIAEYAIYSESEKVERVLARIPDGGSFGIFTSGANCGEWMKLRVHRSRESTDDVDYSWDGNPHPLYAITVGEMSDIDDGCDDYGCAWFPALEELLPSTGLHLYGGPPKAMYYIDIVDECRDAYLREMRRRMAQI